MSVLHTIIVLLVLCSFAVRPDPIEKKFLSLTQFNTWNCANLCSEENMESWNKIIAEKCAKFKDNGSEHAYTEEKIMEKSGCKSTFVKLTSFENAKDNAYSTRIGICYLSNEKSICISRAEKANDALIWSRSSFHFEGMEKPLLVCQPEQIIPDFWIENTGASTSTAQDSGQNDD